ncbi:hypothetical protein [Mangrovibacterium marinum]|uniref:Uncharacterized protein n=1 Tax=Mangrovibacterium marinum TaxID=1639118 RepID=A0A2T5C675_9BACT|nr:hypothetical protein [Mangrovibacterium marinum]PTN10402.1 hypothetical protein C8N47_10150 [Mangrovibacterium marinum]
MFSKSYQVVVQNSITEQGGGLINEEELEPSGLFLSRPESNEKLRETGKLRRETEITRLNLAFRQMEVADKNQP